MQENQCLSVRFEKQRIGLKHKIKKHETMKEYKFKHIMLGVTLVVKANAISDAIFILAKAVKSIDDYVSLDYNELVLSFRPNIKA